MTSSDGQPPVGQPPVRIFLRPIGSPLTIGMSGLIVASLIQSGLDLHWIPKSQSHQVGLILIAVPFVLQLLACVFSYLARDGATGAALGVLSTSWLAMGLLDRTSSGGSLSGALGLLLLGSGGALAISAIAAGVSKPLPAVIFGLAAIRFLTAGIYELSATAAWQHAAGLIGLVILGLAAYTVIAFELESQLRRPVLPTLRRGRGADGVLGPPEAQIDSVSGEAGVRQMT